ncbi:hypothetical protein IQ06DRAFT_358668 [Phaeosphaeriaceae sp. SRC1lsM3a]|nr:hypothetical protein IQ06DRAFT_358668 [Stagonospora sp. SRC1lsM3a]
MAAVSDSGAPFVTITPRPNITPTAGPDKPTETILTSPQDGHTIGDVAIQVTEDLANRLTEMINRNQQCLAARGRRRSSDAQIAAVSTRDVNGQIAAMICAAKSLVMNAVSGGPFAELSLIKGQQPAWLSADLAQAMGDVASFAVAQSSFLQLNDIDAATLGYVSFYLAFMTVIFEPWVVPLQVVVKTPIGVCPPPPGNATDFPLDAFKTVYSNFCSDNDQLTKTATRVVNSKGEDISTKSRLLRYAARDDATNDDKYKDYRFTLAKVVRENEPISCATTCEKAFEQLSGQDGCKRGNDQKSIADTGFLDAGCAAYSFMIEAPKPPEIDSDVKCGDPKGHYSAPKYDSEAAGAMSVESAIKKWCAESDNFYLHHEKGSDQKYGRWDITQLDVPKRSSFWPRAILNDPNQDGIIREEQCVIAFTDGLKQCDAGSGRTHGFSATFGTATYALELSGYTNEGNPPWDQHPAFPPPEDEARNGGSSAGDPYGPMCDKPGASFKRIFPNDLEATINSFCVDGIPLKPFKGAGGDDRYPKKGDPRFYESEFLKMFLSLGAEPMNRGGNERPYFEEKACE